MTDAVQRQVSKLLSLVLRHQPETIGLRLDAGGWAAVPDLLRQLAAAGHPLSEAELRHLVAANDKQRFAFSADGARIRASQGHSVAVDLELQPSQPPATLYHGTVGDALPAILNAGLQPMARRHVHLSADLDTARRVGQRRGKPVILLVDAGAMTREGFSFYQSENGVWLTDAVPPRFLQQQPHA